MVSGARSFDIRACRVTNRGSGEQVRGRTRSAARRRHGSSSCGSATVAKSSKPSPPVIRQDDVVAIHARQEVHMERGGGIGPEVDDKALLDIPIETLDVVVTLVAGKQ